MTKNKFPEIENLEKFQKEYRAVVIPKPGLFPGSDSSVKAITIKLTNRKFDLFVFDEYDDLNAENQLLSLCLALRELEEYEDAEDYPEWCRNHGLDPTNEQARNYHMGLRKVYHDIEQIVGHIDSQISDLDFQLNSGAAQYLRNQELK